jgi:putative permease
MSNIRGRQRHNPWQYAFFVLGILFFFLILFNLPRLSIPLMVSYVMYLVFLPLVPKLQRIGIPNLFGRLIIVLTLLFVLIYPIVRLVPFVKNESSKMQNYLPKAEVYIKKYYFEAKNYVLEKYNYEVDDQILIDGIIVIKDFSQEFLLSLPSYFGNFLEWIFLVPIFLFFLFQDGRRFKRTVLKMVPNPIFERVYFLSTQFNKKIGDYIFAKVVEATILGTIIGVGLTIVDLRFSLLLGVIAGLTNIIPYVGPVVGTLPGLVVALVEFGPSPNLYAVALIYIIANAIDIALIFPILVSKIVDLHPVLVILSVILGSQLMGVAGMVISIPIAASIKLIIEEIYLEFYQRS